MGLGAVLARFHVRREGFKVVADLVGGQADKGRANADHVGARILEGAHVVGAGGPAAADDGQVAHLAHLAHALQADRQDALAGHAACAVAQYRVAVGGGVTRPHGVDGAEAVCTACLGGAGDNGDIGGIRGQFGNYRDIHHGFYRADDLADHVRVLAHGHAVALGVGAGEI